MSFPPSARLKLPKLSDFVDIRRFGSSLGNAISAHNVFVQGHPTAFHPSLIKHFLLVEATVAVPAFALSVSHYLAALTSHPDRVMLARQCLVESSNRTESVVFWLTQLEPRATDPIAISARIMIVALQLIMLPFWMLLSATMPAAVHSTLERANDVLQKKYETSQFGAPGGNMALPRYAADCGRQYAQHAAVKDMTCSFPALFVILVTLFSLKWSSRPRGGQASAAG